MTLTYSPLCDKDLTAPDFSLPDPDGKPWTRDQCSGSAGLLVMFICNHCPYVQAIRIKLVRDAHALMELGVGIAAISSNDVNAYPQDSPEYMRLQAEQDGYRFPYLYDADQSVAKAYGAVCTPDFFGYNADLALRYRGRLDASGMQDSDVEHPRELFSAMRLIAATGDGPEEQIPSMGCSIKWHQLT